MELNLTPGLSSLGGGEPYDVIVIGGGPAGSSAALYAARGGLSTLVIDKGISSGALAMTSKVSNYPGVPGPVAGAELVETIRKQAESFGARFVTNRVMAVNLAASPFTVTAGTDTFEGKTLILATGSMGRSASIPGEGRLIGRGVSYCVTCDGPFFRGQAVAVVGNNDEALEEALAVSHFASQVYLLVPTAVIRAQSELEKEVTHHPSIQVRLAAQVKEIVGQEQVEGVRVQPRQGAEQVIPVAGAFVFMQGNQPAIEYLMGQVETEPTGCVRVDRQMHTSVPGVFATGDLTCARLRQAVISSAEGVIAAVEAEKFVRGSEQARPDWGERKAVRQ